MKQVLINLIKNAIEASENGQSINTKVYNDKNKCYIDIQDYGCGISEEDINRLGKLFFTKKENGTGLGLLTSFNLVKEHNGKIYVDSKLGVGTKFTIELPLYV